MQDTEYEGNYLDITDYLKSVTNGKSPMDLTFAVARAVRYNVNEYSNSYYKVGEYHYDGRAVEIATKEHPDKFRQPALNFSIGAK